MASVLQLILFDALGIPFWVSVLITVGLIWLYTYRGGIKTVVWTDTFQTTFMLASVLITMVLIGSELELKSLGDYVSRISEDERSTIFNWDWKAGTNFFKQFISGAFITIVMTGLDQDMMQKNPQRFAEKHVLVYRDSSRGQPALSFFRRDVVPLCRN